MAQSSFREQFGDLARKRGVQESLIPYWTNWVMAWGKYLSPRKFVDAGESDVEAFLQHLADQGKAGWQIEQAEAALKLLHQSRYPAPWSADWKVRQPLAARHHAIFAARDKKLEAARENRKIKRQQQPRLVA